MFDENYRVTSVAFSVTGSNSLTCELDSFAFKLL